MHRRLDFVEGVAVTVAVDAGGEFGGFARGAAGGGGVGRRGVGGGLGELEERVDLGRDGGICICERVLAK